MLLLQSGTFNGSSVPYYTATLAYLRECEPFLVAISALTLVTLIGYILHMEHMLSTMRNSLARIEKARTREP